MVASNNMKGLRAFISDLRSLEHDDEEKRVNVELAKIRAKFQSSTLSAYDRKKYVSKLLYIYMLGYPITFGHMEAAKLLSGTKYSEKLIGYLAVALLLNENHELMKLVINSIKKDLLSHDPLQNSLALHTIANIGGRELCETVYYDIYKLLMSASNENIVRQKSALALLHIYRKFPDLINPEWFEPIVMILGDDDLNVSLAVSNFVNLIVIREPKYQKFAYGKAVGKLKSIVFEHGYSSDYLYYSVPCPWLQVNLCRILLACERPSDNPTRATLIRVLDRILSLPNDNSNVQQVNAVNAILFEAIKLAFQVDESHSLYEKCMDRLADMIADKESNIRYLAFETTAYLISCGHSITSLKHYKELILSSLRYKDVSLRKKSLELLYMMCDEENAKLIVADLLQYLPHLDSVTQEDLISKVAIISETFATDYEWYVDVTIQLLRIAGKSADDGVWHQLVHVIVNNEEIQEYATKRLFSLLQSETIHECLVKAGGYVLGEFGHLITDYPDSQPVHQFSTIYRKLNVSSPSTRVLLLTTLIKLANLQPELNDRIAKVFQEYSTIINPEVQQRACEYLQLLKMPRDFLQLVCDEVPPFLDGNRDGVHPNSRPSSKVNLVDTYPQTIPNVSKPSTPIDVPEYDISACLPGFYRLCWKDKGILYQDSQIQIGVRSEYHNSEGAIYLYYENRQSNTLKSLSSTLIRTFSTFHLATTFQDTNLPSGVQLQQKYVMSGVNEIFEPPIIHVSYVTGVMRSIDLQLPVLLSKFMKPTIFDSYDFFNHWGQMGVEREAQLTFGLNSKDRKLDAKRLTKIVSGFHWGICQNVDSIALNIVGAGIIRFGTQNVGCLLRIEPNYEQNLIRLSIRSTNTSIANTLAKEMQEILRNSF